MATTQITPTQPTDLPAGDWSVVPARSVLGFETRILFGLIPVRGSYSGYDGNVRVDGTGGARGTLRVEAGTLTTGIKKRDTHLRSSDFFAAEEHPHVTFELTRLVPDAEGGLTATGTLHIREEVLPISTPVSLVRTDDDGLRLDADFDVDHGASGLGWKRIPSSIRVKAALALARTR